MVRILKKIILLSVILVISCFGVFSGHKISFELLKIHKESQAASKKEEAVKKDATISDPSKKDTTVNNEEDKKTDANRESRYKNLELFQKVLYFIENNYVDEVDNEKLVHGAIKGMLSELDPHSSFLNKEVFEDMKEDTSGKFGGLGIEVTVKNNLLTVIAPIEDTPAWNAGVKAMDRIVKIDGDSTKDMSLQEAVTKMRGKKGSKITLSIYREGLDDLKELTIQRDVIKIKAVKYELLEKGYGYVRLASFNQNAAEDVKKSIAKLEKSAKLKGLILDLRTNPGGLLEQAVDVSSLFVEKGVIVSTKGRSKDKMEIKYARKGDARSDFHIVVLVNTSTASAAEIVAGALQDHKRAVIMGQPTFGKGSVQTVLEIGDDMGLKLTIARYFTPNGTSIQEKGVKPDILLEDYDPKLLAKAKVAHSDLREKDLKGHIKNADKKPTAFEKEEIQNLIHDTKASDKEAEDFVPVKFDPKNDYQVKEAWNYLKSYKIFDELSKNKPEEDTSKK